MALRACYTRLSLSIGIDPGNRSGKCVAIDGVSYYSDISLGCSNRQLARWFYQHRNADIAVCELVHARSGFGITSQAQLVGSMEKAKQAASILESDTLMVAPVTWQQHFQLIFHTDKKLTPHQRKKEKKGKHLERLLELMWFDFNMDVETADACLLAYYGLEQLEGNAAAVESSGTI